jgi:hypothetical protein
VEIEKPLALSDFAAEVWWIPLLISHQLRADASAELDRHSITTQSYRNIVEKYGR